MYNLTPTEKIFHFPTLPSPSQSARILPTLNLSTPLSFCLSDSHWCKPPAPHICLTPVTQSPIQASILVQSNSCHPSALTGHWSIITFSSSK